jgi:modulator of drug activity B
LIGLLIKSKGENGQNQMKILIINTHLTYPGWSEGKLNFTFMSAATAFFTERGHQVTETFVERGYRPR